MPLKCVIQYDADCPFPLENLPYGVFSTPNDATHRIGVAIGDQVLDLKALAPSLSGLSSDIVEALQQTTLNQFMALTHDKWDSLRTHLQAILSPDHSSPLDPKNAAFFPLSSVTMHLPATIGDYTDFYSSREHATNVGIMFRGKDNALQPNWLHLPVGYHGRSSSVVVSGTPVHRPSGQLKPENENPIHGPCKWMDFELEMGFFVGGPANPLGQPIPIKEADQHLFGVVILNDWSARDIQKWEYVPLGPFCAKNFASTISPWVVPMAALKPFLIPGPTQENPTPLPYLQDPQQSASSFNVELAVELETGKGSKAVVSKGNMRCMYWSCRQQLVHHSYTGCPMRAGDLLGTGTISGSTEDSYGSMLELSWRGSKVVKVGEEERKFLQDNDTVVLKANAKGEGYTVGFGDCVGKVLPAHPLP